MADPHTVAKTDTAPAAKLGSAGKLGPAAGCKARVNSPGNADPFSAQAAAYRHHRRYFGGAYPHDGGKRVGDSLAARGTAGYVAAFGDGCGITVAAGKAAAPAVRPGKGVAYPAFEGIFGNLEKFPEKTQGKPQYKGQGCGKSRGYKNNRHDKSPYTAGVFLFIIPPT
jgi:hypothetical protein